MKPIILVRHAQPSDRHFPFSVHWADSELTEHGRRQAECTAERLKQDLAGHPCRVWSSDLRRAAQTAEIIGQAIGVPVATTPDLREYKSCLPPAVTEERLCAYVPRSSQPTIDLLANRDAETWPEFRDRIARRMASLTTDGDERLLIVVAHYGANMNVINWWLQIPLTPEGDTPIAFETALASITVLKTKPNGKRCLERLNDIAHLYAKGLTANARLMTSPAAAAAPESSP